jgi:hypothetical protein
MVRRATIPFFIVLAVAQTWPMLPHAASWVLDPVDGLLNAWLLAAVTRSLLAHPFAVFDVNAYYPFHTVLATLDHQASAVMLAGPLYLLTRNPLLAVNLYTIATFALSGIFTARLVRDLTESDGAGLIAGSLFAFSGARLENINHTHVLGSFWLPLMLLAVRRYVALPTWRRWAGLVASALLCALCAWYYAVIAPIALAIAAAADLIRTPDTRRAALSRIGAAALVAAVILGAVALPYVRVSHEFRPDVRHLSDVTEFGPREPRPPQHRQISASVIQDNSASLEDFLSVAASDRVPWLAADRGLGLPGARVFPGFAGALLAAAAIVLLCRERLRASWLAAIGPLLTAVLIVAAVGPAHRAIPLAGSIVRAPGFLAALVASFLLWMVLRPRAETGWTADARMYLILAVVGGALALGPEVFVMGRPIAQGIYPSDWPPFSLLRASSRFGILYVLGMAVLAGYGYVRLTARLGPRRRTIAGVMALLLVNVELFGAPVAMRKVPRVPEVYDSIAGLPAGAVVEFPIHDNVWGVYWSLFHRRPLVNGYGLIEPPGYARLADPDDLSPDMIEELRTTFHARYVIVNTALYSGDAAARLAQNLAASVELLRPVASIGGRQVFEIVGPSRGAPVRRSYRPWMLGPRHMIAVGAELDAAPPGTDAFVELWGNGTLLASVPADSALRPGIVAAYPADLANGLDVEVLGNYRLTAPGGRLGKTGVATPADIAADAALLSSTLQVNGHIWSGHKGYTLAVIAPDGRVTDVRGFNTSWSEAASHGMAAAIRAVPQGWTVVAVTDYDASRALTADAVEALHSLGMTVDLRGRFQDAHAAIGVKGAAPGTALEQTGRFHAACAAGAPALVPVAVHEIHVY